MNAMKTIFKIIEVPGTRARLRLIAPDHDCHNDAHRGLDEAGRLELRAAEITAKLAKCDGKHRKQPARRGISRKYPAAGAHACTATYVRDFYDMNGLISAFADEADAAETLAYFAPLSTNPQKAPR